MRFTQRSLELKHLVRFLIQSVVAMENVINKSLEKGYSTVLSNLGHHSVQLPPVETLKCFLIAEEASYFTKGL